MPPTLTPYSPYERTALEHIARTARVLTETPIVPIIRGDKDFSFARKSPLFQAPALFLHEVYDVSSMVSRYFDQIRDYDIYTIHDGTIIGSAIFWDGWAQGEASRRKSIIEFAFVQADYPQYKEAEKAMRECFQQYEQMRMMFPLAGA